MMTVTANAPFACRQYPWSVLLGAYEQLFVMYQAMLDGCLGSEWSGPICPYMDTAHKTTIGRFTSVLRIGYQMCRMNIEHLTSRTNMESTETATLKSVNLLNC